MKIVYIIVAAVILVVVVLLALVFKNKLTGKEEEIKTLQKGIKTKSLAYSDKLKDAEAERSRIEEEIKTATSEVKEELEAQLGDIESQLSASELELEEAEINLAKLTTENAGLLDSLSEYLNSNVDSTPESEIIRNVRTRAEKIAGELCDCFTKQGGWNVDAGVTLLSLDDLLSHGDGDGQVPPAGSATLATGTSGDQTTVSMYARTGGDRTTGTSGDPSTTRPPPVHHPSTTRPPPVHHPSTTRPPPVHHPSTTRPTVSMYAPTGGDRIEPSSSALEFNSMQGLQNGYCKQENPQLPEYVITNMFKSTTWGQKLMIDYNKDVADFNSQDKLEVRTTLEQKQKAFRKCFFKTLATELDNFKKTEPSDYKTGIFISELGASMLRTKCTRSILTNIKYGQTLQLLADAAERRVEMVDTKEEEQDDDDDDEDEDPESPDSTISGTIRSCHIHRGGQGQTFTGSPSSYMNAHGEYRTDEGLTEFSEPNIGGGAGFTMCVWVKRKTALLPLWDRIIDFGDPYGKGFNIVVSFMNGVTYSLFDSGTKRAELSTGGLSTGGDPGEKFPYDTWVHVSIVQPRQGPTRIFCDGVAMVSEVLPYFPEKANRKNLYIGKSNWHNNPMFKGTMSDLFIWNTNLNDPAIADVRRKHALPASPRPVISMFRTWCQDDDA